MNFILISFRITVTSAITLLVSKIDQDFQATVEEKLEVQNLPIR